MELILLLVGLLIVAGAIATAVVVDIRRPGTLGDLLDRARAVLSISPDTARTSRRGRPGDDAGRDPEEVSMLRSYDRQIASAQQRGDSAETTRLRRESEALEEAWRAQRAIRGRAPKRLFHYSLGAGVSSRDARELRALLDHSRTLTTLSSEDWATRGNAYMAVEDPARAAEVYRRALQGRPDDIDIAFHFAIALSQSDRQREALAAFDQVLAVRPDDPDALAGRGNVLADLGQRSEALDSYREALAIDPAHVDALYNRANLLADDGQFEEAIRAYDETLDVRPDLPDVHNDKGNTLSILGRHDEALAAYDRAVELRPSYARAFYNRGVAFARLGRLEEAVEGFERCLRLRLDIPEAHYGKGVALARLGRHQDAVLAFDRALALRPSFPDAMLHKARAHSRLGQERDAMEWLAQAIAASEAVRAMARDERDFDALRTSPAHGRRFEELVIG